MSFGHLQEGCFQAQLEVAVLTLEVTQRLWVQWRAEGDDRAQGLLQVLPDGRDEAWAVVAARVGGKAEPGDPLGQEDVGAALRRGLDHGVSL